MSSKGIPNKAFHLGEGGVFLFIVLANPLNSIHFPSCPFISIHVFFVPFMSFRCHVFPIIALHCLSFHELKLKHSASQKNNNNNFLLNLYSNWKSGQIKQKTGLYLKHFGLNADVNFVKFRKLRKFTKFLGPNFSRCWKFIL